MSTPWIHDQIRDVLPRQIETARALDSKGATIWAIDTGLVGVTVTVALTSTPLGLYWIWLVPIAFYLASLFFFSLLVWPRRLVTLDSPAAVIADYGEKTEAEFIAGMLQSIPVAFTHNQSITRKKAELVKVLAGILALHTLMIPAEVFLLSVFAIDLC